MTLSIDDLITPLTEDQILETMLSTLETLSIPARSWRKAGARRVILRTVARTCAGFTELMAAAIRSGFLDLAQGPWLRLLAHYVYGVEFIDATFASGQLRLVNSGGGIYSFLPDEVRALDSTTKKAYKNTAAFTLNPGDDILVDFEAVEAGTASSAGPGEIDAFETTILQTTVTNPSAFIGRDAEEDDELRQRCRDKLSTLSPNGPRGAYRYAVLSALRPDGTSVDINRVAVYSDPSTGIVYVIAASPSGTPTALDLGYARDNIEVIARPDTVTVNLLGAAPVALASSITVWATLRPGISASDIETLVLAALEDAISKYPIGGIPKPPSTQGYLYGDYIAAIAKSAHESIFDIDGTADLPLAVNQVATLSTTVTVRIVSTGPA